MSKVKNVFICFGVFWASIWVAGLLQWPLIKLVNINALVRDETVFSGIAMGVMSSLDRTLAAIVAGIVVVMIVSGRKTELWALIVAALYVVDAPVRHHWAYPANSWDRLWQVIDLVFPAVACLVAAFITARLRRSRCNSGDIQPSAAVNAERGKSHTLSMGRGNDT